VSEQLGLFLRAAELQEAALPLHCRGIPFEPWPTRVKQLEEKKAALLECLRVVMRVRDKLERGVGLMKRKKREAMWVELCKLRLTYPHSQLLLVLEAQLCAQLGGCGAQEAWTAAVVLTSLPTCSPELAAAVEAAGGMVDGLVGQPKVVWEGLLGFQCGLMEDSCKPRNISSTLTTAMGVYIDPFAAAPAAGSAAAAAREAAKEYSAIMGPLYPTPAALEAAQAGMGWLLEDADAAEGIMRALAASEDAGKVAVAPLHPFWAAEVYMAQGRAYQRQGQAVLAMRSFALVVALSKTARPAYAALAHCR
jgi:hypothetical protein